MEEYRQWIAKGLLRTHANKNSKEDHYSANSAYCDFDRMDFVVALVKDKNWFYAMSQPKQCWTDEHIDVVFYYLRKKSKYRMPNHYKYTTTNCLFKTYINNAHARYYCSPVDDNLNRHEDMMRVASVSKFEMSLSNIIKGFSIPTGLPWHLVDDIYIPIQCDREFHWVLAVVDLKLRRILVYDSSSSTRKRKRQPSDEIKKLSLMLPIYLENSLFFEHTERTDWSSLDAYKDKKIGSFLGPQHPFDVEFVQGVAQQKSDSLDCGLYVATFAEYLSDKITIPSDTLNADYLRTRYATLLWRYGTKKANGGYVSEKDDPPKPKSHVTQLSMEDLIDVE